MESAINVKRSSTEVRRDIRAFVEAARELPSPRGVALRLLEMSRDPDVGIAEVARVVKTDPALTGFVIRAANAARFVGRPKVLDVGQAVARLGLNMVRVFAIAVSMVSDYRKGHCNGFDYDLFWASSLFSGIAMSHLTSSGFARGEEAFALGLLGDIGRLAMATAAPDEYAQVIGRGAAAGQDLLERERAAFGFDHNELTAVLLADWGIPTKFADVVYWQQDPEAGGFGWSSPQHRLASEIQLASMMASTCLAGQEAMEQKLPALHLRAKLIGLDEDSLIELSAVIASEWLEWSADLGVKGIRPRPIPPTSALGA